MLKAFTMNSTRKKRRKIFEKVTDKDVRERYDATRSAIGIGEFLADSIEALYGYGVEGEKVDQVAAFKSQFESLPEEQRRAVNDYFVMEQKWDPMPILHRNDERKGLCPKPFPFSPGVFRRVLNWTKPMFCKWLVKVAQAQRAVPALVNVVKFDAAQVLPLFNIMESNYL